MFLATHGVLRYKSSFVPAFSDVYSFQYDGVSDVLELNTDINLGVTNTTSLWLKRNNTSIAQPLGNNSNWSDYLLRLQTTKISYGRVPFEFNNSTMLGIVNQTSDWTHLFFVRTGSTCNLWVNGVNYDGSKTNALATHQNEFRTIGCSGDASTWLYSGKIDELAVWDSDQTSNQTSICTSTPSDLSPYSPVGWYRAENGVFSSGSWSVINSGSDSQIATSSGMTLSSRSTDVPLFDKYSIYLDGVSDCVDMGNPASLQITGNISISAWIKTTDSSSYEIIVGKDGTSGQNRSYFLYRSGNNAKFLIFKGGSAFSITGTSVINDGNWHHIVGVNDGTNLKIYVDGVLDGTNTDGGTIDNGNDDFYIGRRGGSSSARGYFTGYIDEVSVFNTDQSANISSFYNSGTPTDLSIYSPVSWWRCGDLDSSPTLLDRGSGGNNGTMVSFTNFSTDVPT